MRGLEDNEVKLDPRTLYRRGAKADACVKVLPDRVTFDFKHKGRSTTSWFSWKHSNQRRMGSAITEQSSMSRINLAMFAFEEYNGRTWRHSARRCNQAI